MNIRTDGTSSLRGLSAILSVARRYKLSSYDASYLELAMRENLPLATLVEGLRRAAKQAGVEIV
jgi:predicted nucleic acid-binding protein